MMIKDPAMMVDLSLCVGCQACTVVCKQAYDLQWGVLRTGIDEVETGEYPGPIVVHNKKACKHCNEAACVMVCPANACYKRDDGLVSIDSDRCIGCNYCVSNCTFGVVQYDQARNTAEKCTLCAGRIDNGQEPLCSEVCTMRAIRFGERSQLLSDAEQRVTELVQQGFSDASVYGKDELGGLKVITVLREKPEAYGLPAKPEVAAGVYAWRYVGSGWGGVAAMLGVAALGFNFLHNRKLKNMNEAKTD